MTWICHGFKVHVDKSRFFGLSKEVQLCDIMGMEVRGKDLLLMDLWMGVIACLLHYIAFADV